MTNRRDEILATTMMLVAEKGLENFATKRVSDRLGVSEALIYKYFHSKDELLYSCFESVHMQIARSFDGVGMPAIADAQSALAFCKQLWMGYLDLLVTNGYRTAFYFAYRNSEHLAKIMERDDEAQQGYFASFVGIAQSLFSLLQVDFEAIEDVFWTYTLDTTGVFAMRFISGAIDYTPQNRELVWALMSQGFGALTRPLP